MPGATLLMAAGGSGILDTQTMTVGSNGSPGSQNFGFLNGVIGSLSDGSSNIYGGAAILAIRSVETSGAVILTITGILANSGWTNMAISGFGTFARADAAQSNSGGNTSWTWASGSFPTSGTVTVTWS